MNLAELSIRKDIITWALTLLLLVGGYTAFQSLSRLEDPVFTIKDAIVMTSYPGATAAEVEEEVTNVLEKSIQQMGQLDWVESRSSRGFSSIKVHIKMTYDGSQLPQVWDELRRKVNDAQMQLPPGAGPSIVNDDFGDVYGVFFALTGEGYSYKELHETAKMLQRDLLTVRDVKRIALYGDVSEVIYVEIKRDRLAELGISPQEIITALRDKNVAVDSGHVEFGEDYIALNPTGEYSSEQQFVDLLIQPQGENTRQIRLGDVAEIVRGYEDPPNFLLRTDGVRAIGLGISTIDGGNVVTMGEGLEKRFAELQSQVPLGMEGAVIAIQSEAVTQSINGFLMNLGQAVIIVVVTLLIFMGLRSGLIIGGVLLITIVGSFIFMSMWGITLERISLGALVIALGMLVDNAIVVADGMRVRMSQGESAVDAASAVTRQTAIPLLGATAVAILAFASIGTSPDSTGEYCRSLFQVILITLSLSWVTAFTITPLLCAKFLKVSKPESETGEPKDPYGGAFYRAYRALLSTSIRLRWITVGAVAVVFAITMVLFGTLETSFFPNSTRPQFYVDLWFPEGTQIQETARKVGAAEEAILAHDGITHAHTSIGGSQIRFMLTYTPEYDYPSFAQVIVDVDDYKQVPHLKEEVQRELEALLPDAIVHTRMFVNGPSTGGAIQLRIYGPDPAELRRLGDKAQAVLEADAESKAVRSEWRNMVKVMRPQLYETQARAMGIGRPDLATALQLASSGTKAGLYRERDELISILARAPREERLDIRNLQSAQIWSPVTQENIPIAQVSSGIETVFENPFVWRRDRVRMLRLHLDPRTELPATLLARVKPLIEEALEVDADGVLGRTPRENPFEGHTDMTLKVEDNQKWALKDRPGYAMAWGGEVEDSARATETLATTIPIFFGMMMLIVLMLFNSVRKTLVIWLCVPLALIGVTVGLLVFKQPFGFMPVLGVMSLAGMLVKNAVVLVDQIDLEMQSGKSGADALADAGVSRLIPVCMAALTTILGMAPLLKDAFFISMAVTIMFGLLVATVLTLVIVPVFYAIFFRVPSRA